MRISDWSSDVCSSDLERHRGFRVAPISQKGYRELAQACLTVELPCLRSSIENGDVQWELNLVATYHRAVRTLELVVAGKEDLEAYSTERLAFYEALLGACTNPWLLGAWRLLYAQNMRYRHMYMTLARFELELGPQHADTMKVILARDVEAAEANAIAIYDKVTEFRSEEHTSELQSLMRISYAVFCLKKKNKQQSSNTEN